MIGVLHTLVGYGIGAFTKPDSVIFLDIDGVLHSAHGEADLFLPACCSHLQEIIEETGASIVLSSMWRLQYRSLFRVNEVLFSANLPPTIGVTPDLRGCSRAEEISQWLERHPEVVRWIAIDDWALEQASGSTAARERMLGHCVQTSPETGLTEQDVSLAIALMAKQ
mmetsp:Transcript_47873/g.113770  ORF Transcript_47873/g.113770 Transcript_47873/m.113770 type:complete len:167 (-) Transcript_47873:95-595(-)